MSKIDELLKNEKVEWKKLGEIGDFYSGITGKKKDDFINGNKKFKTYKNVYSNPATNLNIEDKVKINDGERVLSVLLKRLLKKDMLHILLMSLIKSFPRLQEEAELEKRRKNLSLIRLEI